jgi:DNA-binding NtrC family response regulator
MSAAAQTILVVEDEEQIRTILVTVLGRRGYQVLAASTPSAALELFQTHGGAIDLMISDVIMPEMNGPALAERLLAERPDMRVLFISGFTDGVTLDARRPNISFLGKPFQPSVLAGKVRDILGAAAGS